MLERITNAKCFNLLSLLVMLHITMGMPLVHPFVHAHSGHDEPFPVDNGQRFQNQTDQGETHRCPICGFQATNQLHAAVNNGAHAGDHYTDRLIISASSLSIEAAAQYFEARAPPHFPAVSKAISAPALFAGKRIFCLLLTS